MRIHPAAIVLLFLSTSIARPQSPFIRQWSSVPWDSGGLHPNSVVWSMVPRQLDLDNDGKREFLITTAWSGQYHNAVYLYESASNNSFNDVWTYSFYAYANDYSTVTVADVDGDGRKEIICFVDPYDSTYPGLYVFEWNGVDNGFPSQPTTTWNLGLPRSFAEGGAILAGDFDNDGRDEIALALVESWSQPKSRFMIVSLHPSSPLTNPSWVVEFVDTTTFSVLGYALAMTDLDRDNKKEIVVVGWEYLHMAIYEHTGSANSYEQAADITSIRPEIDFSNMGIVETNFDNDATNELYVATANGNFFIVTNAGSVHNITSADVVLLHQYEWTRGTAGVALGDVDNDGVSELYIAGSYHEAVFQWKYLGGPVTNVSSYRQTTVYQDDTTDQHTPGNDQGWFRPSKAAVGDFDRDGLPDIIIASSSFARDKPVVMMVEQPMTATPERRIEATEFSLSQNYPNPFNPSTTIRFSIGSMQQPHSSVALKVYDCLGREIATLLNEVMTPGNYEVQWDTKGLGSGIYLYRLSVNGLTHTKKMVLVR